MKNINRDYLVTVNVKTAEVTASSNMSFYITDINTCNIFFKLSFKGPNNDEITSLINDKAPKENANDYRLTLRILKPDGMRVDNIPVELRDPDSDFLYVDLKPEQLNILGTYTCELFIDSLVTGEDEDGQEIALREERSTTNSFTFTVIKSIFSDINEVIEADPDYPLLADVYATKEYADSVAKKHIDYAMSNIDLYGFATRDYINQVVAGGDIDLTDYVKDSELESILYGIFKDGDVNLDMYITEEELGEALANKSDTTHKHDDYATIKYVQNEVTRIVSGGDIDLDGYVTKAELAEIEKELESKADSGHEHKDNVTQYDLQQNLINYVTYRDLNSNYVTQDQLSSTSFPANGGNADTVSGYGIHVCSQAEYNALGNAVKNNNVLYFIKKEKED